MTPDTILRWYRRLVAKKYDGSETRRPGRPSTKPNIAGTLCPTYSKPFDLLVRGNETGDWLLRLDSNQQPSG